MRERHREQLLSRICTVTLIALLLHRGSAQVIEQTEDDSVFLHPEMAPLRVLRPISNRRAALLAATASSTDHSADAPSSANDHTDHNTFLSPIPVNAAGFKCEDSALVEAAGTKCSLLAKTVGPLGCQRILAELAAERGRNLDQVPAAFRNRRVADACPHSCGLCASKQHAACLLTHSDAYLSAAIMPWAYVCLSSDVDALLARYGHMQSVN